MLEVGGNPLFELNPVAAIIWAKLSDGLSPQEITGQLVVQFGVPEERVTSDVTNFVQLLQRHLLIKDKPSVLECPVTVHAELVWNKGIAAMCDWRIPDEFPVGRDYSRVPTPEGHVAPPDLLDNLILDPMVYRDIRNGDLVWVKLSWLKSFVKQVLPFVKAKVVLVTGDSDTSVPSGAMLEAEAILRCSNIVHWYAQNCDCPDFMGRMSPIPIGIDFHTLMERRLWGENISSSRQQELVLQSIRRDLPSVQERIHKVYIDFAWQAADLRPTASRQEIVEKCRTNECVYLQRGPLRRSRMWRKRGEYAFVLSPHGVGLDCHRTWEALALGHIVLVPSSQLDSLYAGLPVIPIRDWSEITPQTLEGLLRCHSGCESNDERLRSRYWVSKMRSLVNDKIKSCER
jgi:Coenzyme PQQ synthesis protein D (PqqD)